MLPDGGLDDGRPDAANQDTGQTLDAVSAGKSLEVGAGDAPKATDGTSSDLALVTDSNPVPTDAPELQPDASGSARDMTAAQADIPAPAVDVAPARAPNGTACSPREDCQSNSCAPDGHCCDTDCTSSCEACDVAGHIGRCTRVPSGQPHGKPACSGSDECAGRCDGNSVTCVFPTSTCGLAACSGNVFTPPGTCNGAGTCSPGGSQNCRRFSCTNAGCRTNCGGDGECSAGNYCAGAGGCVVRKPNGSGCTGASQCVSGFCSDQICCNEACSGACRAGCSSGTCAVVKDDVDLDSCHTNNFCGPDGACISAMVLNKSAAYDPTPLADYTFQSCSNGAIENIYLHRGKGSAMTGPGAISFQVTGQPYFKLLGTSGCDQPQLPGATCSAQIDFFPMGTGAFDGEISARDLGSGMTVTMKLHGKSIACP